MSFIDSNPRLAWAQAYETGMRTQAAADMEEAGCKVQTSGIKGGGGYNDHYVPVYSAICRMEQSEDSQQRLLASIGHWLSLNDTGEANQHIDIVAEAVLGQFIALTSQWAQYRKARKQRVEALIVARLMQDRDNVDGERPPKQPREICHYTREYLGIKIVSDNWKQDGWDKVWLLLGEIIKRYEDEAMEPVMEATYHANREMRNFLLNAA
ncbi:MAG: hypothetical protein U9Q35_01035 [Pseudomonadota bacterium]|nr:hypothetical protein [Pseudomonadota bacterium]